MPAIYRFASYAALAAALLVGFAVTVHAGVGF
jgi:hypothetical protein